MDTHDREVTSRVLHRHTAIRPPVAARCEVGCADGRSDDHVMLAPPFIIDEAMIPEFLDPIATAVDEVLREAPERGARRAAQLPELGAEVPARGFSREALPAARTALPS